jgi:hypothetical protein
LTFWRRIESLSIFLSPKGEEIKKDYSHEIATSYNTFLAMTDWVNEILMPSQNEGSG